TAGGQAPPARPRPPPAAADPPPPPPAPPGGAPNPPPPPRPSPPCGGAPPRRPPRTILFPRPRRRAAAPCAPSGGAPRRRGGADVQRLLEHIKGGRLLAVVAASGSGKSSLVRAGLLPALRQGALPGSEHWRAVVLTPGQDPLGTLAAQLQEVTRSPATPQRT